MSKKRFTKQERSSFPYWFSHWCSFNLVALTLGVWKFKYLFHDWEKPWLRLFLPYKNVQKYHRRHSRHHIEYYKRHGVEKTDWVGMAIDWECSNLTKIESPRNAADTLIRFMRDGILVTEYGLNDVEVMMFNTMMKDTLKKLGIYTPTAYYSHPEGFDQFIRTLLNGKKYVAKLYTDMDFALHNYGVTVLAEYNDLETIYMSVDGDSYIVKGRFSQENGDRPHIVVFSSVELSFRRMLRMAWETNVEVLDISRTINQEYDFDNLKGN